MTSRSTFLRITLLVLLGLLALNAFGGGYYGARGATDIPRDWLEGSPFTTYLVPSIVLAIAVGGSCLVAAIALAKGARSGPALAVFAGFILATWIAIQIAIIGWVSPLQPTMFAMGALVIGLASVLRKASLDQRANLFDSSKSSSLTPLV